jgi:lipid II:glycine glycyltransferase (peptidoglycan interpeptide bridge formation enzyme)
MTRWFTRYDVVVLVIRQPHVTFSSGGIQMIEAVTQDNLDEYENFVQAHPKGHFLQSHPWSRLKSDWEWDAFLCRRESGEIAGSMAVLSRKVPGLPFTLCYGCRGPVCDPHDAETVSALFAEARALAKRRRAYNLKIDPDLPADDDRFAALAVSAGFKPAKKTDGFETVQPRFVFRLRTENRTPDEVLASFHQKWRYNIRLAERKGVTVRVADENSLDEFNRLMAETGARDGFVVRGKEYFRRMLQTMGKHARLYMVDVDGTAVAGAVAIHYGDKVWYLYGASDTAHRSYMPCYLMQWAMIQWALELNCRLYDFRGVSGFVSEDNPLYGLYRFKKGFNGDFTEFIGEFDMVLHPWVNWLVTKGKRMAVNLRMLPHRMARKRKEKASCQAET